MRNVFTLVGALILAAAMHSAGASEWDANQKNLGLDPLLDFDSRTANKAQVSASIPINPPGSAADPSAARLSGLWHGWLCAGRSLDIKVAFLSVTPAVKTLVFYAGDSVPYTRAASMELQSKDNEFVGSPDKGDYTYYFRLRPEAKNDVLDVKFVRPNGTGCFGVLIKDRASPPR